MSVCRTCLQQLANAPKYSVDHIPENTNCTESLGHSSFLNVAKMIEKCVPEMDLDICDSPVICENCYRLLMNAYKFRVICVHTEERIYQYIEKNNLRLGESIDLNKLSEKSSHEYHIVKIENENETLKEETSNPDVFEDMPNLLPEITLVRNEVLNVNESSNRLNRKVHDKDKTLNKSQSKSDPSSNINKSYRPRRKVCGQDQVSYKSRPESDSLSEDEINSTTGSKISDKKSKYKKRSFSCDKCQYKGSKWDLLKNHLRLKCGVKAPPKFKCEKCAYTSIRLRNVKRHQLTHGGKRPWVCGVCKKGFTERSHLKYHMFKHQPDKPLPIKCQEEGCNYACARKCDLNAHMLTHMKGSSLFCRVCKKMVFLTKMDLLKHEKACKRSSKKTK